MFCFPLCFGFVQIQTISSHRLFVCTENCLKNEKKMFKHWYIGIKCFNCLLGFLKAYFQTFLKQKKSLLFCCHFLNFSKDPDPDPGRSLPNFAPDPNYNSQHWSLLGCVVFFYLQGGVFHTARGSADATTGRSGQLILASSNLTT